MLRTCEHAALRAIPKDIRAAIEKIQSATRFQIPMTHWHLVYIYISSMS